MTLSEMLASFANDLGGQAVQWGAAVKASIVAAAAGIRTMLKADLTWTDRTKTLVCGFVGVFVIVPGITEYLALGPRASGAVMFVFGMGARPMLEWLLGFLRLCREDPGQVFGIFGGRRGRGKNDD